MTPSSPSQKKNKFSRYRKNLNFHKICSHKTLVISVVKICQIFDIWLWIGHCSQCWHFFGVLTFWIERLFGKRPTYSITHKLNISSDNKLYFSGSWITKMALDFVAGCIGGCAAVAVGHPFDTIKVRLQTQDAANPRYRGAWHCFTTTLKSQSVRGLYRGMSSPMAGVSFVNSILFGVHGNIIRSMKDPSALR